MADHCGEAGVQREDAVFRCGAGAGGGGVGEGLAGGPLSGALSIRRECAEDTVEINCKRL
jgi:hypothetical protein